MECERIEKLLSPYLDKNLTGKEISLVEDHLKTCSHCPRELERLKRTIHLVSSLEEVAPPKNFLGAIHRRLKAESGLRRFLDKLFFPLPVKLPLEALAAVLIAVGIIYLNPFAPPPREMVKRLPAGLKQEERWNRKAVKSPVSKEVEKSRLAKGTQYKEKKSFDYIEREKIGADRKRARIVTSPALSSAPAVEGKTKVVPLGEKAVTAGSYSGRRALSADYKIRIATENIPLSLIEAQKVIYLNNGKIISPSDKEMVAQVASKDIKRSRILFELASRNYSQVLTQLKEVGKVISIISPKKAEKEEIRRKKKKEKPAPISIRLELTQAGKK